MLKPLKGLFILFLAVPVFAQEGGISRSTTPSSGDYGFWNRTNATIKPKTTTDTVFVNYLKSTGYVSLTSAIGTAADVWIRRVNPGRLVLGTTVTDSAGILSLGRIFGYGKSQFDSLHVVGNTYLMGNVGIGTTSPLGKLHVVGTDYTAGTLADVWASTHTRFRVASETYNGTLILTEVSGGITPALQSASNDSTARDLILNPFGGNVGIGTTEPTALLHLKAGTATASTAPLKLTSGTLLTTAEAGAVEFLTDTFYGTITTGAARKQFYIQDGTDVALADGGTNASLTASNGGIFYSTATAGAILAGTATAGQMLRSGASTAPTWSTPTFPNAATAGTVIRGDGTNLVLSTLTIPNTAAVSTILYASAANVISALATANNGVLVTSDTGVPSISADIPTSVTIGGAYNYRASGTDVAVADGGTGGSVASITLFNNITGYTASGATGTTSTNLVFSTSPTLITPALGTPSALVLTNATGLPAAAVLAGTFGTGAYVMDASLTVPTIVGGTATTSDLNLKTTSGVGATGADMHFLVGNNGATEAMTILNDGSVAAGTVVRDTSSFTTTATRTAIYIAGATSTDQYVITKRYLAETLPAAAEDLAYTAVADSLVVTRESGATSGLKFSFIRIK